MGCVGGIYGIGGGSILAPILIGTGRPASEVAPVALGSTLVTSVAGVVTFTILSVHHHRSVAPDWPTGIALGIGGLAGAYTGARIQFRLPEVLIRRLVGVLVVAIGACYLAGGRAWALVVVGQPAFPAAHRQATSLMQPVRPAPPGRPGADEGQL